MPEAIEDFWPEEISEPKKVTVPSLIAAQQAALLGKRTKNVVTATVISLESRESGRLGFGFNLVAPTLSNYRLRLFNFHYRLDQLYPVTVYKFGVRGFKEPLEADNEKAWKALLKIIFSSPGVVSTIQALRAQSEDIASNSDEEIPF